MSPTQRLRDMLDDLAVGGVNVSDLMRELDRVEKTLGLPKTTPNDERD